MISERQLTIESEHHSDQDEDASVCRPPVLTRLLPLPVCNTVPEFKASDMSAERVLVHAFGTCEAHASLS